MFKRHHHVIKEPKDKPVQIPAVPVFRYPSLTGPHIVNSPPSMDTSNVQTNTMSISRDITGSSVITDIAVVAACTVLVNKPASFFCHGSPI